MEVTIRDFEEKDVKAITAIINHNILYSTSLYDYNTRTDEMQLELLRDKLKKGFPVIVAFVDETVVGFGYYGDFRAREAYQYTVEHSVYVNNDFTKNGIGKLLLLELISRAKKQNLHTMIGVIDSENTESIEFHKKHGFKVIATIPETGFKFNRWLNSVFVQLILEKK